MSEVSSKQRIFALELGKLVAAFVVAMIHLTPCTPGANHLTDIPQLFAVPYFMISAIHFTVRKSSAPGGVLGSLSFQRVAIPYFTWTLLYLLMRMVKNGPELFSGGVKEWFGLLFMGQSAVQLYFLPLLLFNQIVASAAVKMWEGIKSAGMPPLSSLGWLSAALVASLLAEKLGYFGWNHSFTMALLYALLAVISNQLGLVTSLSRRTVVVTALLAMGAIALVTGAGMQMPDVWHMVRFPLFGFCSLMILLRIHIGTSPAWLVGASGCYFGIYLSHHAIEEVAEVVMTGLGHSLHPYTLTTRFTVALLVCMAAVLFTLTVRRQRLLALLMLGERIRPKLPD